MTPMRWSIVLGALLASAGSSATVSGQDLYTDIQREFRDESRLQRDVSRYQYDLSTGHYARAAFDKARIANDEAVIRFDQAQVQNDFAFQGIAARAAYPQQALQPHPQYPGYFYYPSQPGQLYYDPTAPSAAGGAVPAAGLGTVLAVAGTYPGNVAPPVRSIQVQVANTGESGVAVNFAIDGVAYSVPGGFTQRVAATAASVVEFDRGEPFGGARYGLSDGPYEFRPTDRGWELYKKPVDGPAPSNIAAVFPPRNVAPRTIVSSTLAVGPTPSPEQVPPPPMPPGPR